VTGALPALALAVPEMLIVVVILASIAVSLVASAAAVRYVARVFRRFARPEHAPCFETPADHALEHEPFSVTTEDGVRISGWLFTPPEAHGVVIVCHPRNSNKSRVLRHIKILVDGGMAVVVFDFRGCGDSGRRRWKIRSSMAEPLRDLEAVARLVERRVAHDAWLARRIALFGCSFGGNMAIAHAGTTGRCYAALVLDSTPLIHWQDMLGPLLERERRGSRWHRLRAIGDRLAIRLLVAWTGTEALYRRAQASARNLRDTPLLLILGERDGFFDVAESCRFAAESYAGAVEPWHVPRGRHLTNHWAAPEEYAARVRSFLDRAFEARDRASPTSTYAGEARP
jgi:pimeloyl-ACP methyl ester carboxylesterase